MSGRVSEDSLKSFQLTVSKGTNCLVEQTRGRLTTRAQRNDGRDIVMINERIPIAARMVDMSRFGLLLSLSRLNVVEAFCHAANAGKRRNSSFPSGLHSLENPSARLPTSGTSIARKRLTVLMTARPPQRKITASARIGTSTAAVTCSKRGKPR